jgi:hypothetical protein
MPLVFNDVPTSSIATLLCSFYLGATYARAGQVRMDRGRWADPHGPRAGQIRMDRA